MAKFNGVETDVVILKASDGTETTVSVEDSGSLNPNTLNMENLDFFFRVDGGDWLPTTKTVNWAKMVENINNCQMINKSFTNYAGAETKAQRLMDIAQLGIFINGIKKVNESTYGYQPWVGFLSEANANGMATTYPFATVPTGAYDYVESMFKEIRGKWNVTFKSSETEPVKICLFNGGYQVGGNVVMGYCQTNLIPDNSAHTVEIKITW